MKKLILLTIFLLALGVFVYSPDFALSQNSKNPYILNKEIEDISKEIDTNRNKIKSIEAKQKRYLEEIKKMQSEQASLNNQIAILDNRLAKAELDIEMVEAKIDSTELEIQRTTLQINNKIKEIEEKKYDLSKVINLIYKRDNVTTLEILLLNDSLSDFISELKYLEDVNDAVGRGIDDLTNIKTRLEEEKVVLKKQEQELADQKKELEEQKKKLATEVSSKSFILTQVTQSEKQYLSLLEAAKKEQEQASANIAYKEKLMRAKLAELEGKKLEFDEKGLIWPVPKNVITAGFHDPTYPFRHIFEHPAIDIRAAQGTPLKAAASGYVANAVTGGATGYGYVMIVHGDGLATVYGHVSKIYVKEDDFVVQGQLIGATGGMPGTPGAGRLTTGPHLHFEVRLNGIPVNPLNYLP